MHRLARVRHASNGRFPSRINTMINFLPNGHSYVIERFGKFLRVQNPGLSLLIPFIDKIAYQVDNRELCLRIAPEHAFTKDNVEVTLGGNLFLQFFDAERAAYGASQPLYAANQFAQSVMRTQVGSLELDELFEKRNSINSRVVENMTEGVKKWGCSVHRFEITDLEPADKEVAKALNRQASAERTKRETVLISEANKTKVINEAEANLERIKKEADAYRYKQEQEGEGDRMRILMRASAEKDSIGLIAGILESNPQAMTAIQARLSSDYFKEFGKLASTTNTLIVPSDITNIARMISVGSEVFKKMNE